MASFYAEVNVNTAEYRAKLLKQQEKAERDQIKDKDKRTKKIKKIASKSIGIALTTANYVNAKVGQYTGNKMRQSNVSTLLTISGLVAGAFIDPFGAAIAASALAIKSTVDYSIRIKNAQQESNFKMSYRGNMTTSGSRWKGIR